MDDLYVTGHMTNPHDTQDPVHRTEDVLTLGKQLAARHFAD